MMKKSTASRGVGSNYKRVTVFAESRSDAIKRAAVLLGSRKGPLKFDRFEENNMTNATDNIYQELYEYAFEAGIERGMKEAV